MVLNHSEQIIEKVEKALRGRRPLIPRGRIASYASVGQRLGLRPMDVGKACSKLGQKYDPTKVPYHRIVHKDGKLPKCFSGGGLAQHRVLLRKEEHVIEKLILRWRVKNFVDHLAKSTGCKKK